MGRKAGSNDLMTFGGHLEVFRRVLFRILGVSGIVSVAVFCFKDATWRMLLAPSEWDFVTYSTFERMARALGITGFSFPEFHVKLIATDLTSQFMTHLTTSVYLGLLAASPYILYELFRFVSPALFDNERKYSAKAIVAVYILFIVGVLVSYFLLFPISFRFLGTYQVSPDVENLISLQSYMETMMTITLMMGVVFEIPILCWLFARLGILTTEFMQKYRRHAIVVILVVAAIITPTSDVFTLSIVALPIYLLYEWSIFIVKHTIKTETKQ